MKTILDFRFWILDYLRIGIVDFGFWILDYPCTGSSILDFRFWDFGLPTYRDGQSSKI